jgi:hypothetical protein
MLIRSCWRVFLDGEGNGEGEGGGIKLMYFTYFYEIRTMKLMKLSGNG